MTQRNTNSQSEPAPHNFHVDRDQAITQLEALGCSRGDTIYVRAFLPKEDPRYGPGTGRKADKLNWEQVERWQAEGYGVYIVVNGGGHKDEDITDCRAIFCEFDDRPIEDQINFWQELGLPEPSLQIATRKSVHTYWVFDEPIPVEQWRALQTALLSYTGSDPALKNPSRVMRLAGAYHIKPGHDPVRCDIIHTSDNRYSHEELRTKIPMVLSPGKQQLSSAQQLKLGSEKESAVTKYERYEDIQIPVTKSVPLEVCLSKESRLLLSCGVSEGGRNTNGAKLARDLIGTASHLQTIGQHFDGHPRQVLDEYAERCTPPLPAKEIDAIWKSASKDRPGPSCKAEGVEACIRGWYWNNHIKPKQHSNSFSKQRVHGFGNNSNGGNSTAPIAAVSLVDRVQEVLKRYERESEQVNALMGLAAATGRNYNEIRQLARIIRDEGDLAAEVIVAVKSLQSTLKSCRKRLDVGRYIEPLLAEPLLTKAAAMPTAPEYLFNTVLPASASRLGTTTRVVVKPEGSYAQPCVFWTANVAHSGQAKTPPQQVILKPLEEMEADAKQLHDLKLEDYESEKNPDAKPPVRLRRLLNNVTTSTKIRIHEENPRGLLEYIDELVADYQRLNQYKSGKGDDLQLELAFWNGAGGNYDRQDARLFLKHTGFSKTGTYQWDTLAQLMADDVNFVSSGYSARFLYCSILDAPARYLDLLSPAPADTLKEKLQWLYEQLENMPSADYLLSHEAKVLFQGWNHTLVNAEIEESHYGLSLVYAKIESYTARLALWLHIVNAVLRGEKPLPVINEETMKHAIEIASFYLWQHKLIHAHNAPTRQLEGIFLKVQTQAEKFFVKCGKGVNASFLKTRVNALKSWVVEKIRSTVLKTLAAAGHGRVEGEGAEMIYIPNTVPEYVPPDLGGRGRREGEPWGMKAQGVNVSHPGSIHEVVSPFPLTGTVGEIGDGLVGAPIAQNITNPKFQYPVGEIGENNLENLSDSYTDLVPGGESDSIENHQFTSSSTEISTAAELQLVDAPTNLPPISPTSPQLLPTTQEMAALILQCQTWVELATRVGENSSSLQVVTKTMTSEQRQGLTHLLATHLCSNSTYLSQLEWVPMKLRDRALSKLTFTIQRIGGVASNVLDASLEYLSGCKFVSVAHLGTRSEQWIFQTCDGKNIPVFGTEAIEAIALV